MPKVWNKKDPNCPKGKNVSYVGRPSKYGNPYAIGFPIVEAGLTIRKATREDVVKLYGEWLQDRIKKGIFTIEEIQKDLGGKDLVCWCAPELCHADILLKLANSNDDTVESQDDSKT